MKVEKKTENPSTSSNTASKPKDTVNTKTTTATERIKFKTINQNDKTLNKGVKKVVQEGKNGVETVTYKETYKNGKLTSKEEISSKITIQPVDEIVKVGTKEVKKEAPKTSKYLSASEAHSILAGSGMKKVSSSVYNLNIGSNTPVTIELSGSHVTRITFNVDYYIPWKVEKLEDLEAMIGDKEEAKKEYEWAKQQVDKIEKAVRAAANAVYGAGTSQANSLYNEIIKSKSFARDFK